MAEKEPVTMRTPFPAHQISKLPKPTKSQTDEVKADYTKGIRCAICGGWHHPKVVHLDYVGHAALTDRLLDVDTAWTWEPLAMDAMGHPALDGSGGLWIRLTVLGVTRLGYGDAQGKIGGDAMKERIGDALRNAAMRFGAALDLWHKGDLHIDDEAKPESKPAQSVAKDHWDTLTEPDKRRLQGVADTVRASMEAGDMETVIIALSEVSEVEEKTALWSRFLAPERAAIKKYQQTKESK